MLVFIIRHAGTRLNQVRALNSPVWQHTFVSPSAFSRRAVVSYWRKYVLEVLVNRLGGLSLPRKSVVRLTDRPDMTLDVYRGRKTTMQQCNNALNSGTFQTTNYKQTDLYETLEWFAFVSLSSAHKQLMWSSTLTIWANPSLLCR